MDDSQPLLTPALKAVDRGVPLQPPALSIALVNTASSPSRPPTASELHTSDTHLLQSARQAKHAAKMRKRRAVPPKDSKVRRTVFAALALKAQGIKNKEVAESLGITVNTLKTYMYRAHKAGWLHIEQFEDPDDKLEIVLKSKTIRNLNTFLDKVDKDITLETAKGLGLFKQHQSIKNDAVAPIGIALSVNVEMPASGAVPVARVGSIGGQPYFDAEVVDEEC